MKTTTYNHANEITVGIWIAIVILSIFTAIRVRDLKVNNQGNYEIEKTTQLKPALRSFPAPPVADARLIDEPANEAIAPAITIDNGNIKQLVLRMKTWVGSTTCWNEDLPGSNGELANKISGWMKNGAFFILENEENIQRAAFENTNYMTTTDLAAQTSQKVKSWIKNGAFWSTDNAEVQSLAATMGEWLKEGNYWSLANE